MSHYEQAAAVGVEDSPAELAYAQVHATLAVGAAIDRFTRLVSDQLAKETEGDNLRARYGRPIDGLPVETERLELSYDDMRDRLTLDRLHTALVKAALATTPGGLDNVLQALIEGRDL